ncbi:MAG TPA: LysR family transcriptional regulator [Chloroflexota bacterium]|jgi:DNA-binding transcriptional LysR family regulator|nr:LysR family transcriptional regulator [Chloroflexota bacterium]
MESAASLYHLRTFHLVASERSFTRAARRLHLSQPAVSAHIRALERRLGTRLFQVRHRQVYLTEAGEALYVYSARVFALLQEAERAVAATQGVERGRLRLGASTTIGHYLLPPALVRFAAAHPGVQVEVAIGTTAEIVARVRASDLPCGLVEAAVSHPDLEARPFASDEMVLIVPPDHPWAKRGTLPVEALRAAAILRREPGSGTQLFVDQVLARAGVLPDTAMVLGSTEALKQAVLAGGGVAWVPRITVQRELQAGTLVSVPVQGLDLRRPLWVVCPRGAAPGPATEALLRLLAAPGPGAAPAAAPSHEGKP